MKTFPRRPDGTRKPTFETEDELLETFAEYKQWLADNPIKSFEKTHVIQGDLVPSYRELIRSPTQQGWANFIGVTPQGWRFMCGGDSDEDATEMQRLCKLVDCAIKSEMIELAAAEAINPGFVARLVGLAEKTDHVSSDGSMTPKGRTLDDFYKEPDVPAKSSAS